MTVGHVCEPNKDIVLILSHYWTPIGVTSAKDGIRKLYRECGKSRTSSNIFALDEYANIKNWDQWVNSSHDEFYADQPYMRTAKNLYPVPTVLLTTARWSYKCSNTPTVKYMYKRYKGVCQICGDKKSQSEMTLEHILPKSLHGTNDDFNLTMTCFSCNNKRGNIFPYESYNGNNLKPPKHINNLHVFFDYREEWKRFGITILD